MIVMDEKSYERVIYNFGSIVFRGFDDARANERQLERKCFNQSEWGYIYPDRPEREHKHINLSDCNRAIPHNGRPLGSANQDRPAGQQWHWSTNNRDWPTHNRDWPAHNWDWSADD